MSPAPAHILTPAQLDCLASPVRAEILRTLDMAKRASARELAARLGRSVTRLYHHLALLQAAGLIAAMEARPGRRKAEAVYALVAPRLSSEGAARSGAGRRALAKVCRRFLSTATKRFERALGEPGIPLSGPEREVSIRQVQARLSPAAVAALNAQLDAIMALCSEAADPDGRPVTLTIVVTPGS